MDAADIGYAVVITGIIIAILYYWYKSKKEK